MEPLKHECGVAMIRLLKPCLLYTSQLIEFFQLSNHLDLLTAVQLALHEVIGAYAIEMCIRDR